MKSKPGDRSFLGGLGGTLGNDVSFRVGVGARLQPFAQVRWDRPWVLSPGQVLALRETLFWSRAERFGATTALTYELELQRPWTLRWLGAATITQETRNVEWSGTLGVYRDFGPQRFLSLELPFSGTGTRGAGVGMSDRGVLGKWQQPIYKDWLLGELAVGYFWLRPDALSPRGRAWALGYSLRMYMHGARAAWVRWRTDCRCRRGPSFGAYARFFRQPCRPRPPREERRTERGRVRSLDRLIFGRYGGHGQGSDRL